ncbi:uncharacterized protein FOMMEDRAFT_156683 [Fomitiporia mediterranea MF3/22]|uniref:uncharacterized protein n=1 Tax=Fomitiporia mediterranea (strain MF3/22) TaxID=694068 RepID=UPI00044098CC|nr:uncharacterized protein FOMMEDRAFT_156683 [Fomitiporia mediterranea MF3/22]EJD03296.1 hypothetical protein FOMMEDRAFT_156683 [Fomitiporia mediterranea MF3/22]
MRPRVPDEKSPCFEPSRPKFSIDVEQGMPVRNISSSEVGIGREVGYHASSLHFRHSSGSDDASGAQLFVNRPRNRKKSDGLNGRMNKMLLRLNTSFIGEFSTSITKRPRNPSVVSAASTLSTEPPQTPIDVIHNTVRSNNLGDGFTIIRTNDSKKRNRPDFLTNKDLPSWTDSGRLEESEKEPRPRELPEWLSQTFSTLEPDHPLHALALPIHSSFTEDETTSYVFEDAPASQKASRPEEVHNGTIFAFLPPDVSVVQDHLRSVSPAEERLPKSLLFAEYPNYAAREQATSLHAYKGRADLELTPDDVLFDSTMNLAAGNFVPFAEPGPFVQKTVHFLTPDRGSNHSSRHSLHYSGSPSLNRAEQHQARYKPFSTPGPTSFFPFTNSSYSVSDSSTPADYALTDGKYNIADGTNEEDATFSVLSFTSSAGNYPEEPFSTPGPALYASPLQYFDTPDKDRLPPLLHEQSNDGMELELGQLFSNEQQSQALAVEDPLIPNPDMQLNNIELEIGQLASDEDQIQAQKMIRFIEREHSEMLKGMRTPPAGSKIDLAQGDTSQEITLDAVETLNNSSNSGSREKNSQNFLQHAAKSGAQVAPIEVFSSPPYIRFKPAHSSRSRKTVTTKDDQAIEASPDLRLDRLPSPVHIAIRTDLHSASAMPRTPPRPKLQNVDPRNVMEVNKVTQAPESTLVKERLHEKPKAPTSNTKPEPRKPRKPRRAFAPVRGVYLSPIRDAESEEECTMGADTSRSSEKLNGNKDEDEAIWNINPSQISDDSIEDWET